MTEKVFNQSVLATESLPQTPLITIRQFCGTYPWPSQAALRSYVFRASYLGLDDAFIRVRRRVLVNPARFFQLIKQLQQTHNQGEKDGTNQAQKQGRPRF